MFRREQAPALWQIQKRSSWQRWNVTRAVRFRAYDPSGNLNPSEADIDLTKD
jgi:hypothetical protein